MKTVKVYSETYGTMIVNAPTIEDAIQKFNRLYPKHKVKFAFDIKFTSITKQYQNGSNEVPKG